MASCPYRKDPMWIKLVEEVGELQAYAVFIDNGHVIPDVDTINVETLEPSNEWSEEKDAKVEALRNITELRSRILSALTTKHNIYKDRPGYLEDLEKLIKKFVEADIEKGVHVFIANAEKQIKGLRKKMDEKQDDLQALKYMNDFVDTFEMVGEILEVLQDSPYGKYEATKSRAAGLSGLVEQFRKDYITYARKAIVTILANNSTIMRENKRMELKREFEQNNDRKTMGLSKAQYDSKKRQYVEERIQELNEEIFREEKKYIRELLKLSPKDIDGVTQWAVDPRNINDHLLQLAVKILDNADHKANQRYIVGERKALNYWKGWVDQQGRGAIITDQKRLYEGIIEKIDGKETNYYVRPLYSTYYTSRSEMYQKYNELVDNNELAEASALAQEWRQENLINPEGSEDSADNVISKWQNSQYDQLSGDKLEMYNFLVEFNKESDNMVKPGARLGYRLPSVNKTLSEKVTDNGLKTGIARTVKENLSIVEGDTEYGDLATDSEGKLRMVADQKGQPLQRVALPFRSETDIENQSFDLMGIALSNRFVSLNFEEKSNVQTELEVLKDLIAARQVEQFRGGKQLFVETKNFLGVTKEEETELSNKRQGDESKLYKLYNSVLEDRLYGKHNIPTMIGNVSVDKITKILVKASADNMLIANLMGATANAMNGKVMNFFESTRRMHYDRKDLVRGEGKYVTDIHKIIGDYESITPTSKTNLLIDKMLDTSVNFSPLSNELTNDNKLKRAVGVHTLHGLNASAEHYIQGTLLYSIMNNIKVMKNGEYINENGEVVERKDAMTMDEAYVKNDDGLLEWGNSEWTIEGYAQMDNDAEASVRRKAKDIVADLQGMYDEGNKSMMRRYWWGRATEFLRKWMVRGVQRRWRGLDGVSKNWDELPQHKKFYSESAQQYKVGTYTSLMRFTYNAVKDAKSLSGFIKSQNWNELHDFEKGNIKAAVTEIGLMLGAIAAANFFSALAGDAPEDDKKALMYGAYYMRRIYGEMMFYVPLNPNEAIRMVQTPSAVLATVSLWTRFGLQMIDDIGGAERYEKGEFKGRRKSEILFYKSFVPGYKSFIARDVERSLNFLENGANF